MTAGPSTTLLPVPTTEEPSTTTTTEAPSTTTTTEAPSTTTSTESTTTTTLPTPATLPPDNTVPDLSEPTVPTSTTAVVTVPTSAPPALAGGGDGGIELSTETKLVLIVGALLAIAAVLTAFTVHYWRVTRPAAPGRAG